jgi:hypothetical protein
VLSSVLIDLRAGSFLANADKQGNGQALSDLEMISRTNEVSGAVDHVYCSFPYRVLVAWRATLQNFFGPRFT